MSTLTNVKKLARMVDKEWTMVPNPRAQYNLPLHYYYPWLYNYGLARSLYQRRTEHSTELGKYNTVYYYCVVLLLYR